MAISTLQIDIRKSTQSHLPDLNASELKFGRVFSDHMFTADFVNGSWTDLQVQPFGPLSLSPANAMMHYGQSIFEGLKAYKNAAGEIRVFRPEMNARRLNQSATRMCMATLPEEIFIEGIKALMRVDADWVPEAEGRSMYIRPFMIATDDFLGVRPSESYKFLVIASPSGSYYGDEVRVKIERSYSRASAGGTGSAKTAGNYAAALYPAKLAQEDGYDQLIWTDSKEHKYIEEAGTMNVMFLQGTDTLITSPLTSTILPGVTRDSILQIARDWGMQVEERPIAVDEIVAGIENGTITDAFGVGTAATIAHISEIGMEGNNYTLPPVASRNFSLKMKAYLEDLKRGRVEDPYGWMVTC
ncbi:MAG: branched-chain amino acid aminotransferase [Leptolyngbya sp. SIO3F4]|nr:branched-chain amino acid aminotransferase [Leptolyngbya sp. SIO3F4]